MGGPHNQVSTELKAMKSICFSTIGLALSLAVVCSAQARNDKYLLPIKAALESSEAREKPDGSVKFS